MVNRADINSVLMQMRQVRQQIQPTEQASQAVQTAQTANPTSGVQNSFANQLNNERAQMMSRTQVQNEVTQADFLARAQAMQTQPQDIQTNTQNSVPEFREMFGNAINNVNETQMNAGDLATRFTQGDPNIDLPEVMVALQKSSVSFQAMTQVRNKLLEAYKDIMNMPV